MFCYISSALLCCADAPCLFLLGKSAHLGTVISDSLLHQLKAIMPRRRACLHLRQKHRQERKTARTKVAGSDGSSHHAQV
jgi:hypothetical protein